MALNTMTPQQLQQWIAALQGQSLNVQFDPTSDPTQGQAGGGAYFIDPTTGQRIDLGGSQLTGGTTGGDSAWGYVAGSGEGAPVYDPAAYLRQQGQDPNSGNFEIQNAASGSYYDGQGGVGGVGELGSQNIGLVPDGRGGYTLGDTRYIKDHSTDSWWTREGRDLASIAAVMAGGPALGSALSAAGAGSAAGSQGISASGLMGDAAAFNAENGIIGSSALSNSQLGAAGLSAEGIGSATGVAGTAGAAGTAGTAGAATGAAAGANAAAGLGPGAGSVATGAATGTSFAAPLAASSLAGASSGLLGANAYGALAGAALGGLASLDTPTQTTQTQQDPATQAYLQQYRDRATQVSNQPFTPYTGELVAGMNQNQQQAGSIYQSTLDNSGQTMNQINGLLGQGTTPVTSAQNGLLGQTQGYFDQATQAQTATANPYAQQDNPYLQGTIDAANQGLIRNYNTLSAPKYAQGSSFGNSGLAQYEVTDRANMAQQLANNANTLSYQGYNQAAQLSESGAQRQDTLNNATAGRQLSAGQSLGSLGESAAGRQDTTANANANRYLQGASQAQSAALLPNQMADSLLNYGNQYQQTQQAGNDAAYAQYLRQMQYPAQQLGLLGQATGLNSNTTQTSSQSQSPYAGLLGGAVVGSRVANWLGQ